MGCGAVGAALTAALVASGYTAVGATTRGRTRGRAFARRFRVPVCYGSIGPAIGRAHLILVTVGDAAIADAGALLRRSRAVTTGSVVAHTSGAVAASALGRFSGAAVGSLHPLTVLASPKATLARGVTFVLEGDRTAQAALRRAVIALHGRAVVVSPHQKPRYHAAAVLASNLVVALVALAARETDRAGLAGLRPAALGLARAALDAVFAVGFERGLTGPLVRGDLATVQAHLRALDPKAREIYRRLSLEALPLAKARGVESPSLTRLRAVLGAGRRR
ncbi:MAG: DUF2520 domain-containing protein [Deltaproteobacteria bacterium]|nr:DUF2520 domain-containing protein [Deltaproteobacteria bacterium]